MTEVRITHIGGPTTLIEAADWRLLTDPTFDPAGRRYSFGWGTSSRKTTGPAVTAAELPPPDAVLLTHDHHADNLDTAGRALLPRADVVLTTPSGARRLGGNARGLDPWTTWRLQAPGRPTIEVTATPARHGPRFSRPIVGEVTGFALTWAGQSHGALWISGDTVLYGGVRETARRVDVGTALLHLGGVRFPVTGPLRYTMTAARAAKLCGLLAAHTVLPVHYEGWSHFQEARPAAEAELAATPGVRWLPLGTPQQVTV
jgi:L-ascorbate metabolism protein UlaG (beta-lactamase superfamily)